MSSPSHTHVLSKFPIDYFPGIKEAGSRKILSWMWLPSWLVWLALNPLALILPHKKLWISSFKILDDQQRNGFSWRRMKLLEEKAGRRQSRWVTVHKIDPEKNTGIQPRLIGIVARFGEALPCYWPHFLPPTLPASLRQTQGVSSPQGLLGCVWARGSQCVQGNTNLNS